MIVCDDHAVVRTGLRRLLESLDGIDVVATAADGHDALEAVTRLRPDVVLMDLSMPHMDGVAATRAITNARPPTRVVVLTSFHHRERIANAIAAGASGYALKDATPRELEAAIRSAADPHPRKVHADLVSANRPSVGAAAFPRGPACDGLACRDTRRDPAAEAAVRRSDDARPRHRISH